MVGWALGFFLLFFFPFPLEGVPCARHQRALASSALINSVPWGGAGVTSG